MLPGSAAIGRGRGSMDLRFEVFMDELEAHADPTFGNGRMPEINVAAKALIAALEAQFVNGKGH